MPQRWRLQGSRFGGFEYRRLSAKGYQVTLLSKAIFSGLHFLYATACGVLVLYLIKSALDIALMATQIPPLVATSNSPTLSAA